MNILSDIACAAIPVLPYADSYYPPDDKYYISVEKRWAIVALWKDGRLRGYIADKLNIHRTSVSKWINHYQLTGTVDDKKRSGRPRCTDELQDTSIVMQARVIKFTSPRQIKKELELDVSRMTIDRRLQEAGLFGRVARHKRDYTEEEVRKRLSFANGYKNWTKEMWEKVLFSDEKCFYGKGFCGRVWVRRPIGEALNPEYCVHKVSHPVKVNVWACFCAAGVGYCHIFNETLDGSLLKDILADNLVPSAQLHFSFDPPEQWFLLHDNDKKFTSDIVKAQLHRTGVTTIDFPPYSPDLNPMENLWNSIAREVEKYNCDTIEKLQDVIADEWEKIDKNLMQSLVHSMPTRCKAVIDAKGWHTKY
jgi:transposase